MTPQKLVKAMGSFNSIAQVARYIENKGFVVIWAQGLTVEVLDYGTVEMIEKNGRLYIK